MAYPTSAISFTTKNAGDTVQPGHVNDLQTEVAAIEQGLLNGIAHNLLPATDSTRALGSSALRWVFHGSQISTGTVLPAALASTAGVPSTATFYRGDGEWATPSGGNTRVMAACLVSLDTNVAILKSAETGLNWLVEDDDKFGMHSTSANSSRITFAASTGLYQVGASVSWSTMATATGRDQYIRLVLNDTTTIARDQTVQVLGYTDTIPFSQSVTGIVRVQSTADYATVRVYQQSDTTASVLSTLVLGGKSFWAQQVST